MNSAWNDLYPFKGRSEDDNITSCSVRGERYTLYAAHSEALVASIAGAAYYLMQIHCLKLFEGGHKLQHRIIIATAR
jgi:hypothetical protein